MRRRALLAAVGAGCIALGGCLGDDEPIDGDTATKEPDDPGGNIAIRIDNQRDVISIVTVTVTARSATVFEDTVEVAASELVTLDPSLDETGEGYELIAETDDGRRDTYPFSIEGYDVRNSVKLLVWIDEDRLETGMQE